MGLEDSVAFRGEIRIDTFEGDLPDPSPQGLLALLDGECPELWADRHQGGHVFRNLVTNVGRQQMTKLIVAETTVGVGYVALSTSVIVPALADLTLPGELIRKVISVKQSISTYYQRYIGYFTTTDFNSTAINAAALNDTASTGGNMYADASIALSKTGTSSATIDWRIQSTTG